MFRDVAVLFILFLSPVDDYSYDRKTDARTIIDQVGSSYIRLRSPFNRYNYSFPRVTTVSDWNRRDETMCSKHVALVISRPFFRTVLLRGNNIIKGNDVSDSIKLSAASNA